MAEAPAAGINVIEARVTYVDPAHVMAQALNAAKTAMANSASEHRAPVEPRKDPIDPRREEYDALLAFAPDLAKGDFNAVGQIVKMIYSEFDPRLGHIGDENLGQTVGGMLVKDWHIMKKSPNASGVAPQDQLMSRVEAVMSKVGV